MVLDADGVVLRYGAFYGPGTYAGGDDVPPPPRIHVHDAALPTLAVLDAPAGTIITITEES